MSLDTFLNSTPTMRCPWDLPKVPPLHEGQYGEWEVKVRKPPMARGYCSGFQYVEHDNYCLSAGRVTWMSCTPMKLESHAHHLYAMHGTVVIAGGGLGIITYNALQKDSVDRVLLVEAHESVVELMHTLAKEWPNREKLTIIHANALEYVPDINVTYLYADIWPTLGHDDAVFDMDIMCTNISPDEASWWGMEYDFMTFCLEYGRVLPIDTDDWTEWRLHLDLWLPDFGPAYPQFAEYSVRNQLNS